MVVDFQFYDSGWSISGKAHPRDDTPLAVTIEG
jgi:hypothetical protein